MTPAVQVHVLVKKQGGAGYYHTNLEARVSSGSRGGAETIFTINLALSVPYMVKMNCEYDFSPPSGSATASSQAVVEGFLCVPSYAMIIIICMTSQVSIVHACRMYIIIIAR